MQNDYKIARMFISDGKFLYEVSSTEIFMMSLPLKENVSLPKGSLWCNCLEIHISFCRISPALLEFVTSSKYFLISLKSHMVERKNLVSW